MEFHSDGIAVVQQLLAVNHPPAGRILVEGSNPYDFTSLPGDLREYASAVGADVISERSLFAICGWIVCVYQTHYDDDRQPPFHSSSGRMVQRDITQTFAY